MAASSVGSASSSSPTASTTSDGPATSARRRGEALTNPCVLGASDGAVGILVVMKWTRPGALAVVAAAFAQRSWYVCLRVRRSSSQPISKYPDRPPCAWTRHSPPAS